MNWPKGIKAQEGWYRDSAHITDIMPTLIELTQSSYPKESASGYPLPALRGASLIPAMDGKPIEREHFIANEHENNALLIDGKWKLTGYGVTPPSGIKEEKWELYNLEDDRTELNNLAKSETKRLNNMVRKWKTWADQAKIYPKPKPKDKKQ